MVSSTQLKAWHGRLGVTAALFVLVLAITGFCLNHTSGWGLDKKPIMQGFLLELYGVPEFSLSESFPLQGGFISRVNKRVFFNGTEFGACDDRLHGAVALSQYSVIACGGHLLLFSSGFTLIEDIGSGVELPSVHRLGVFHDELYFDGKAGVFLMDIDTLAWRELRQPPENISWSSAQRPPDELRRTLVDAFMNKDITYERLLLDIHSGRILGSWGVYLVDIMAVFFVLLAASGLVFWWNMKSA